MSRRKEEEQYWVMSQQLRKLEQMFDLQQGEHAQVLAVTEQLQSRIELLNHDNARLKADLAEQTARSLELTAQIAPLQESLERKDSQLKQTAVELEQIKLANSKAVGEQKFLQDEILKLTSEQQQLYDDYETALNRLEAEAKATADLTSALEESKAGRNKLKRQLEAKSKDSEANSAKLETLAHKYEVAVKEINALKYTRSEYVAKLAATEEDLNRFRMASHKAEQDAEELKHSKDLAERRLEETKELLKRSVEAAAELKSRNNELESELRRKELSVEEIDMKVIEIQSELRTTKTELESAYCAHQDILKDNAELQYLLKDAQVEADTAKATCEDQQRQIKEWKRKDEELRKYFERKERVLALRAQAERELAIG